MAKATLVTVKAGSSATALSRIARTLAQLVAADAAAQPIIDSLQHVLKPSQVAAVSSAVAGIAFLLSTIQNVLEHFGVIPTMGASK